MNLIEAFSGCAVIDLDRQDFSNLWRGLDYGDELMAAHNEYFLVLGYEGHSYGYLMNWLTAHRPLQEERDKNYYPGLVASSKKAASRLVYADPADKLLAVCVSGGPEEKIVRVSFTVDALKIFDGALQEVLDYHGADDPPFYELTARHTSPQGLVDAQQQIRDILAAIARAASAVSNGHPEQGVIDAIDALVDEQMAGGEVAYYGRFRGVDTAVCSLCGGAWHGNTWTGIDLEYDLYSHHGRLVGCPGASSTTGPQRIRWRRRRQLRLDAATMQLATPTAARQPIEVNDLLRQTVAGLAQMAQEPLPTAHLVPLTSFATLNTLPIAGTCPDHRTDLS
ncbi:hypothetical protein [Mycobacteroides abscessus]|uniref:hypothetical protein n=1 Tax=Mycobacteroides abscessus TaxID=36809 RepID=UPI00092BE52F|nr:hypothetical protein [Mycobacteroides abscessus]SHP70193.1 Uncharacterised protein [Mycobacteroides abscessus subsp. bolletii]SHS16089.1 Uncharacterised protein [Mycobacteroides abscessus subsp. bolletii]SHS89147.1 Uncharacterised protein [Mycobacteroides abscessus subsp. bolletii]SKF65680.1 Uncharacterised protein [Mycobacteroides abscessus subsp. bolletii]SKG28969.1 Uncharacterised protein [Mycobacteroides abscessus subsp. bolletii]